MQGATIMFDRYVITPIIALGLAFLVWVYLRSRDQEVQTYPLPLEISVAVGQSDRFVFETKPVDKVRVRFFGLPSRLREVKNMVEQDELRIRHIVKVPIEIERLGESNYKEGLQLDTSSLLNLPLGVHAEIAPADGRVAISLKRIVEKTLQLRLLPVQGNDQYELDPPRLEPGTVKVTGPKDVLENQTQILMEGWQPKRLPLGTNFPPEDVTETLKIPDKIGTTTITVEPTFVKVRTRIKPALHVYEMSDVPVFFLCPARFPYRPAFTLEQHGVLKQLKIRGPLNKTPEVRAYVDLSRLVNPKPVVYTDEPIMVDLPDGYQLVGEQPKISAFKLELLDNAAKPISNIP
jgi:hypothetical protein